MNYYIKQGVASIVRVGTVARDPLNAECGLHYGMNCAKICYSGRPVGALRGQSLLYLLLAHFVFSFSHTRYNDTCSLRLGHSSPSCRLMPRAVEKDLDSAR